MSRLLIYFVEYAALRMTAGILNLLPYRAALGFGWINAAIAFVAGRSRVGEARRRMRLVFGSRFTDRETGRLAWESWRNTVFSGVEMTRIPKMSREWVSSVFPMEELIEIIRNHLRTGRGAIIACPHMGSWEMAGIAGGLNGLPVFMITGRQHNPFIDAYMNRLRQATGLTAIAKGSGLMREVLKRLKNGQILMMLTDVRMKTQAVQVPFLGGQANVPEGMAMFARHAEVPIIPCVVTRVGWTQHRAEVRDFVWPDQALEKKDDVYRMTAKVLAVFDEAIRRDPAQWFWYNKRWILDPIA